MNAVFRGTGAVVAALAVAFILVVAVELFSAVVHPLPPDFDGTMDQMCQHVARYPHWVLAVVVAAYAATALAATWIAGRFGNLGCALVVGLLLSAALVFNVSMLPYPIWFKIAALIAIPAAIVYGLYLSGLRQATTASVAP